MTDSVDELRREYAVRTQPPLWQSPLQCWSLSRARAHQGSVVPRIVALSTVDYGLDAIAHVLRAGHKIDAVVGVNPSRASASSISGWADVAEFGNRWGVPHHYVERYDLNAAADQRLFSEMRFDYLWVCGWQRLVPEWLLSAASLCAIGVHGSPDGVVAGRGRSPQNWAIMLACRSFEVAVFKLTPGVDDGPVISTRRFDYHPIDDVAMSYRKVALCVGEMMVELLDDPSLVNQARPQSGEPYYFPQRKPEDGIVDWNLAVDEVWSHCRALSRPYPGLRTRRSPSGEVVLWGCKPFDARRPEGIPGHVGAVFEDGSFLVECADGRLLVDDFECIGGVKISTNEILLGRSFMDTLRNICDRHRKHHPDQRISPRIMRLLDGVVGE